MVLTFQKRFVELILSGVKIHTLRADPKGRWQPGKLMHMATGTRTKHYNCFKETRCASLQTVQVIYVGPADALPRLFIDGIHKTDPLFLDLFAIRDGFEGYRDMCQWFKGDFDGKIIHWTSFRY